MIDKITSNNYNQSRYWDFNNTNFTHSSEGKNLSFKQKAVILGTSAAGMAPVLCFLAHKKGFSLNPVKILKTPVKDWALFKYKPIGKTIEFEDPRAIIATAASSVLGGFVGGALIDDKSNLRAKKREVLNQLLGDVLVPIGCVWLGSKAFNKVSGKLINMMPKINKNTKFAKIFNQISENIPNAVATLVSLGTGIIAGNKVSNEINEKLYHKPVDRGIKASDFAPHVDDLCMATSIMNEGSEFASKIARVIPFALLVPGYETGTAQE